MSIVTRFPPSPTGFMHIGNARTALFNWLYARAMGGKFLVRIEDTDRARYSEDAVQAIFRGLEWLGLDYDGEATSQFERADRHREVAEELLAQGKAYRCYCSPEELEAMREEAKETGRPTAYNKYWRDRDPSEAPEGIKPVIRIKAPIDGVSVIHDEVQGRVDVANEQIDDFIILRSDGTPTYMLAVVVDDHDMGVTHVIRGDDHLNNAFRQKVLIEAMGWDVPVYAHTPLIHGPDGKKFSKRHGAEGIEDYRDQGYLRDALFNYLLRLGWSHGDDEIISREQAIEWFNLSGLGKSAANFDISKLDHLNAHYIKESNSDDLIAAALPFFDGPLDDIVKDRIGCGIEELKSRSKTLKDFASEAALYVTAPTEFEDKAQNTIEGSKEILQALRSAFDAMNEFAPDDVMATAKAVANDVAGGKLGKVGMPLRAALSGRAASVSIFEAASILGKEETIKRIDAIVS